MSEERPRRTAHGQESGKAPASGWQLIAVQSISCLVILLIAFVFRFVGGSAFDQLRNSFNRSIMDNSLIATFAALLDTPSSNEDSALSDSSDLSTTSDTTLSSEAGKSTAGKDNGVVQGTTMATASTSAADANKTSVSSSSKTTAAAGGNDIPITTKKVLYAPDSATFVPLKVNRLAEKPLEKGVVTSNFGYRENPTKGGESFHQGLDIAADSGSPIAAMYFGVVSEIGQNSSYGNYIKMYHGNGLETLYAHCSEILVQKNAVIKAGEIVAKVGSTGDSTGPHLHVEIKLNGINYDPTGVVPTDTYA